MTGTANVHATGLVLGGVGVMVRGPSGSGKSLLALQLLDAWHDRGAAAMLVADDRLHLSVRDGTVWMAAPPAIEGLVELRGRGIVTRSFVSEARLDLVVDLVDILERMPEADALATGVLGMDLPRCPVPRAGLVDAGHQQSLVREAVTLAEAAQKPLE